MTGEFSSRTSHMCGRDEARRGRVAYKRQTKVHMDPYVCALIVVEFGGGSRGRRDVGRVRRISILARSSVCSDIWSISIWRTWRVYGSHLLPSHPRRPTPNGPRARLCHPRVIDTQGVGDYANEASRPYGWRFMGGPKGNVIVQ